ncbi:hypothetical protein V1389_12105 [Flavobacterium rakeshii]|uniref:hypothetical protein n=1 Tax=Flavobacterium rakeshii TaxID=1038845 RepID=UPI002E7B80CF|nr:hypothetical protein [Flavobacterium rakeshii]MEE1899087.1 hypothetical protein [Flavobacterium rakeshii]
MTMNFMLMITTAFIMAALFYVTNVFEDSNVYSMRKKALKLFRKNRENSYRFYIALEKYITENNVWSYNAFENDDITFSEFLEAFKEKHYIEYSHEEETKLTEAKLSRKQIEDFLIKLDYQYEFITAVVSSIQFDAHTFKKQLTA